MVTVLALKNLWAVKEERQGSVLNFTHPRAFRRKLLVESGEIMVGRRVVWGVDMNDIQRSALYGKITVET